MKIYENERVISHPWESVMIANQMKYPSEIAEHVVSVDVLSRGVNSETGKLITEKIIGTEQKTPRLLSKLFGLSSVVYFLERSVVDPKTKTCKAVSTNISLRQFTALKENCEYTAVSDSRDTAYFHRATIEIPSSLGFMGGIIEDFALASFKKNSLKGTQLLDSVLRMIETEGTISSKAH